jgi:hypothetical protein
MPRQRAKKDPSKLPPDAPYWVRLKAWREWRGLSQTGLFLEGNGSVHFSSIAAYEMEPKPPPTGRRPRWRVPSPEALAALAYALDFDVQTFPEFRLARARELLDERVQGLEGALRHLEAFEALTRVPERAGSAGFEVPTVPQELRDALLPRPEAPQRDADTRRRRGSQGRGA